MEWNEIREMQKARIDIACGANKQPGFIGLDIRDLPGVDIVLDLEEFPWRPIPSESCELAISSHYIEHIKPWLMIKHMDEVWRILEVGGKYCASLPYAGSRGYWQDPTHCNGCNEVTWQYFDPKYPLYQIYKPKPWRVEEGFPVYQAQGNMEVILYKMDLENAELTSKAAIGTLGVSVADETKTGEATGG